MTHEIDLVSQVSTLVKPDSRSPSGMMEVQAARVAAEVQARMAIAKRFPRNEDQATARIKAACARRGLAEQAVYEYRRGGTNITGPSIRLAEAIAQAWGNLDTGIVELERRDGESTMLAYCVDLETNTWKQVTFAVPHVRDTKQGSKALHEARDIYETVMNNGSRRLRNCILAIIPGDITDDALQACEKTLASDPAPLADRIPKMLKALEEFKVSQKQIETKFQCSARALTERQVARLRSIYQSLKDGMGSVQDFFEDQKNTAEELAQKVAPSKVEETTRIISETASVADSVLGIKNTPRPAQPKADVTAEAEQLFGPKK